jgi:putative transposase
VPAKNSVPVGHIELADGDRQALVAMMFVLISVLATLRGLIRSRAALHLEVLALRHQLQVLQRSRPRRLRLARADRWLWAWLSRAWGDWRTAVVIVKAETVVAWHRQGFLSLANT